MCVCVLSIQQCECVLQICKTVCPLKNAKNRIVSTTVCFPKITQPVTSIAFLHNPPIEDRKRRRKNCLPQQLPLNHPKTVISPHLKQNLPKGPFGKSPTLRQFYIYHLVKRFWQLAGDGRWEIMEDLITSVRRTLTDGQRVKRMISFSL